MLNSAMSNNWWQRNHAVRKARFYEIEVAKLRTAIYYGLTHDA